MRRITDERFRRVSWTIRLPGWLIEKLDEEVQNRGKFIEQLVLEETGWEAPQRKGKKKFGVI